MEVSGGSPFPFSKFRLAGANTCVNYLLGYRDYRKDLLCVRLFSTDPFLPRDGCLLLSVFRVTRHKEEKHRVECRQRAYNPVV